MPVYHLESMKLTVNTGHHSSQERFISFIVRYRQRLYFKGYQMSPFLTILRRNVHKMLVQIKVDELLWEVKNPTVYSLIIENTYLSHYLVMTETNF